jgi:hypothetical protein
LIIKDEKGRIMELKGDFSEALMKEALGLLDFLEKRYKTPLDALTCLTNVILVIMQRHGNGATSLKGYIDDLKEVLEKLESIEQKDMVKYGIQ